VLVEGSCGGNQFLYDGENRMVADPAANAAYLYDGNGMRVEKCFPNCTSPSSSTVYIYADSQDIAEYDNGASPGAPSREFIYSDSLSGTDLLASIVGGTTTYFHPDHLEWRVSTNSSGQIAGQQGTYPYGQSWYTSNGNEFVFTTYQRDSESSLDYAMARYYDGSVSRFCTVDPLGGQIDDPQTLDRYAYVRNDPINISDPTGQGFWSWFADALSFVGDLFTGGAFLPETIQLTTSLTMTADLAAFADVVHVGMQTMPQGQAFQGTIHPSGPRFPYSVYVRCATAAFGGTKGSIPGTTKSIPSYDASTVIVNSSVMVGADPASTGVTMGSESNYDLSANTQVNRNGTEDIGPMQVNSRNPNLQKYPGAAGSASANRPFNGDPIANGMAGAATLKTLRNPARYVGNPRSRQGRQRRRDYQTMYKTMKAFTDCLLGGLSK
jgi:RHS repeat-associated protein